MTLSQLWPFHDPKNFLWLLCSHSGSSSIDYHYDVIQICNYSHYIVSLFCPWFCCCCDKQWSSLTTQFQESLCWCRWCPIFGHSTRNMRGDFGKWYLFSNLVPWDSGHGTRNMRGASGELVFILQSGVMTSQSWHQKYERGFSISLYLSS